MSIVVYAQHSPHVLQPLHFIHTQAPSCHPLTPPSIINQLELLKISVPHHIQTLMPSVEGRSAGGCAVGAIIPIYKVHN